MAPGLHLGFACVSCTATISRATTVTQTIVFMFGLNCYEISCAVNGGLRWNTGSVS